MRIVFSPELLDLSTRIGDAQTENYPFTKKEKMLIEQTDESLNILRQVARDLFQIVAKNTLTITHEENDGALSNILLGEMQATAFGFSGIITGAPYEADVVHPDHYGLWLPYHPNMVITNLGTLNDPYIFLKIDTDLAIEANPRTLPFAYPQLPTWSQV